MAEKKFEHENDYEQEQEIFCCQRAGRSIIIGGIPDVAGVFLASKREARLAF